MLWGADGCGTLILESTEAAVDSGLWPPPVGTVPNTTRMADVVTNMGTALRERVPAGFVDDKVLELVDVGAGAEVVQSAAGCRNAVGVLVINSSAKVKINHLVLVFLDYSVM